MAALNEGLNTEERYFSAVVEIVVEVATRQIVQDGEADDAKQRHRWQKFLGECAYARQYTSQALE